MTTKSRILTYQSLLHQYRESSTDNRYVMMRYHRKIRIKRENVDTHHSVALTNALYVYPRPERPFGTISRILILRPDLPQTRGRILILRPDLPQTKP